MMRPSRGQIFTRRTGLWSTLRLITLSMRAIEPASPRNSPGDSAGSAMPTPARRVTSSASRIASCRVCWRSRTADSAPSRTTTARLARANLATERVGLTAPVWRGERPGARVLRRMSDQDLVDRRDHIRGILHAYELEVGVVSACRVEVDGPDLEQALEGRLAGVHVLHPVDPRLLNVARDDPVLDVQALVGDRVLRREAPDEARDQH